MTAGARLGGVMVSFALLVSAGCKVGPKYVRPPATVTALAPSYKEALPANIAAAADAKGMLWSPAEPADAAARGDWWTIFADDGLNYLEPQVRIANQNLKAADARYRQAQEQVRINKASLYPTVGIAPFVGGIRDSNQRPYRSASGGAGVLADFQIPLELSYEVDLWGRIRRFVAEAKEETQASAADLANAQLSLEAQVAMYYFEVRSLDAQKRLLADTVTDYRDALRVTTNRFEGGVTAKSDVYQAQTQLQAALVQEQDLAQQRGQDEHAIAVLIGKQPAEFELAERPLQAEPPVIPSGLPSQLLERRPDIAAAERRVQEANERIGIARAAYFPTVAFNNSFGLESVQASTLFTSSNLLFGLGPSVNQTLYDTGRRRAQSQLAYASFDEQTANYRETTLQAFQQVEDSLVVLNVLAGEAEEQRAATRAAQSAQQIFNNRYVGGVDTYLQVVTAQTVALSNERNDINIMLRRMDASVLLIKALGGGWNTAKLPRP